MRARTGACPTRNEILIASAGSAIPSVSREPTPNEQSRAGGASRAAIFLRCFALTKRDRTSKNVVTFSERAGEVLREINAAMVESDAAWPRKYVDETEKLKTSIPAFLGRSQRACCRCVASSLNNAGQRPRHSTRQFQARQAHS